MNLTPETLAALGVLFNIILIAALQFYNSRNAIRKEEALAKRVADKEEESDKRMARKDEVLLLREEVNRLSARLAQQDTEIMFLRNENTALHKQMVDLMSKNERLRRTNADLQMQIDDLRKRVTAG